METRTVNQRLDDLENDNNVLRSMLADSEIHNLILKREFDALGAKVEKMIREVRGFLDRFTVVQ